MKTAQELAIIVKEVQEQKFAMADKAAETIIEGIIADYVEETARHGGHEYTFNAFEINSMTRDSIARKLTLLGYTLQRCGNNIVIQW